MIIDESFVETRMEVQSALLRRLGETGIINIETSERNGGVVESFPVQDDEEVIMVTNRGKLIRLGVKGIRIAGRVTQGVTLLNTEKSEKVVSVTTVKKNEVE